MARLIALSKLAGSHPNRQHNSEGSCHSQRLSPLPSGLGSTAVHLTSMPMVQAHSHPLLNCARYYSA
eukprot:1429138-Amphidinium_carterae.1